jgi:hypothetical protein
MDKEKEEILTFPYVVNICYSLGHWLKDYGYYPKQMPLFTYMDHGMTLFDQIPPHEVRNDAPLIFKFAPRLVETYRKNYKKPVYNLLNPTIHFRQSQNIEKAEKAHGSLFYVGHSTPLIDDLTDWDNFIEDINALPQHFHPIDISLHPSDVEKGLGKVFEKKGFKVFCADKADSLNFIENFYEIIRKYKYALSNLIGSYTFYTVEMGIPFSLYGEEPKYLNKGDKNVEMGTYNSYKGQETYQKAEALFRGLNTTITKEQNHFVNLELGKYTTISRKKAAYLLYKAFLLYSIKHPANFKYLKTFFGAAISEKYIDKYRSLRNLSKSSKLGDLRNQ